MKKVISIIMAIGLCIIPNFAFAKMQIIENNAEQAAPEYEITQVFASDANNPDEKTRYEGVPNLISRGDRYGASYYYLGDGNYCTKLESGENQPIFIGYSGIYYSTGIYIIEFDIAKGATSSDTIFQVLGKEPNAEKDKFNRILSFVTSGDITFQTTDGIIDENYQKVKEYKVSDPPNKDTWTHLKFAYDIDEKTFDLYINGLLIRKGAALNYDSIVGFRLTHRAPDGGALASVYVDNYFIGYDNKFNSELFLGSKMCSTNSNTAYVRRIPIIVDRQDAAIFPFFNSGAVYVPLRFIADCYGASISYNEKTAEAVVTRVGHISVFKENSISFVYDGVVINADKPPITVDGRIFVTVEAAAKALGTNIYYDENGRILCTDYFGVKESDFNKIFENIKE